MHVIKNGNKFVHGIHSEEGWIEYALGERLPKLFDTEQAAAEWWGENAPTLPPVGESNIRVVDAAESVPVLPEDKVKLIIDALDLRGLSFFRSIDVTYRGDIAGIAGFAKTGYQIRMLVSHNGQGYKHLARIPLHNAEDEEGVLNTVRQMVREAQAYELEHGVTYKGQPLIHVPESQYSCRESHG